jgi:hypothetical protein
MGFRPLLERGLFIAPRKPPLSCAHPEAAEPLKVFFGVVSPAVRIAPSHRQRTKALTEPQPARGYTKLVGGFADGERVSSSKHALTIGLTDRFI